MFLTLVLLLAFVTHGSAEKVGTPTVEVDPVMEREGIEQGRLLYGIYCRNCHGAEGRGDGPEAKSLESRPPDLTRLSKANDGEFPTARVMMVIDGRQQVPGHVKKNMPIWGMTFQESGSDTNQEGDVRENIERLVAYLKSIQHK